MSRSALLGALVALPLLAYAQSPVRHVRGTVTSLAGNTLNVRETDGTSIPVTLTPGWAVAGVKPITLAAIKPGSYIGAAATGPGDHPTAIEVLVFPEALRGAGEGQYGWDLPQTTMTNGTVSAEVASSSGRVLTVNAKGKTVQMTVPENVPVVTFEPGTPALVTPGAHVFLAVMPGPNGTVTTSRVAVGVNGTVPPM